MFRYSRLLQIDSDLNISTRHESDTCLQKLRSSLSNLASIPILEDNPSSDSRWPLRMVSSYRLCCEHSQIFSSDTLLKQLFRELSFFDLILKDWNIMPGWRPLPE